MLVLHLPWPTTLHSGKSCSNFYYEIIVLSSKLYLIGYPTSWDLQMYYSLLSPSHQIPPFKHIKCQTKGQEKHYLLKDF